MWVECQTTRSHSAQNMWHATPNPSGPSAGATTLNTATIGDATVDEQTDVYSDVARLASNGPWYLLNCVDSMARLIGHFSGVLAALPTPAARDCDIAGIKPAQPAATPRTHLRSVQDIMRENTVVPQSNDRELVQIRLREVVATSSLFHLRYYIFFILFISPKFKMMLIANCPRSVATYFAEVYSGRFGGYIFGSIAGDGAVVCALTPLEMVPRLMADLKMVYGPTNNVLHKTPQPTHSLCMNQSTHV
jgi:hypothetical protein